MNQKATASAGQYLTFALGQQSYGVQVQVVREINQYSEVTNVPNTPAFVKGVINLRGKIIPVVDLKTKFSLGQAAVSRASCIVVIDCDHGQVGIVVDQVEDVVELTSSQIEASPHLPSEKEEDLSYLMGMGKIRERVIILIDIAYTLSRDKFLKNITINLNQSAA